MSRIAIDLDDTLITTSYNGIWKFKKGCVDALVKLRDRGYEFCIVTARPDIPGNRKAVGMVVSDLLSVGVVIQKIAYTNRQAKGSYAKDLGCAWMIDDHAEYLSDCLDHGVIPIHLLPSKRHESRAEYKVVYSWGDIAAILP